MDKRVVLSVAGSGKTSYIINSLDLVSHSLILTYTDNNLKNITNRVFEKFDCLPPNITIMSYFTFLYKFCYKPFLSVKRELDGLFWDTPPKCTAKMRRNNPQYYFHGSNRAYHNRLAKLFEVEEIEENICARVNKYFDVLYVDEVQDFGGHDFNFLINISKNITKMILVGDFFQHTYDTSRDGNVNRNLYNNFIDYTSKLTTNGFTLDLTMLSKSYRCSPTVCKFVSDNLFIDISSHKGKDTLVKEVTDMVEIEKLVCNSKIIKLFYQNHIKYNMFSLNWGSSKGLDDFEDICVVLNAKTYGLFVAGKLDDLNPQTRNKLYVACTRAKRHLYFIEEAKLKQYKHS